MTELVSNISRYGFTSVANLASGSYQRINSRASDNEILLIGLVVAALQILDGVLTAIGVNHFGVQAEGNPLIRHFMLLIGPNLALFFVKSFAVLIVATLCVLARRVFWIAHALRGVAMTYLLCAIVPWTHIILTKIY